jgi:hypothetical protein
VRKAVPHDSGKEPGQDPAKHPGKDPGKNWDRELAETLARIAAALDRLAPAKPAPPPLDRADAYVWRAEDQVLDPVDRVNRLARELL